MNQPLATDEGIRVRVSGQVQGVGYRPWVWRIASALDLAGSVRNEADAVVIEAWGAADRLQALLRQLRREGPPMARVEAVADDTLQGRPGDEDFRIVASADVGHGSRIVPDIATCADCLAEMRDPADRRYRYPFISCSQCGPRLSIVERLPWDRERTTMRAFPQCVACAGEYADPRDRRFHAQTNACPACGPELWYELADGRPPAAGEAALQAALALIRAGGVLACKSTGGWQLVCDASHAGALARLRDGKQRPHKPFALIARDLDVVRRYARVGALAERLLAAPEAPILLLDACGAELPAAVAPALRRLGFMLPHAPLQHLLLESFDTPLVMTSANAAGEPQLVDDDEARAQLAALVDGWLGHDRPIAQRVDDSVLDCFDGCGRVLRAGRGYAPLSLPLPARVCAAPLLALGGHLKNSIALADGDRMTVSQHIGDLDGVRSRRELERAVRLYLDLLPAPPRDIVCDRHPDYASTLLATALASEFKARVLAVQHHHAHLAACLLEHGLALDAQPVLGVILDGLGYGADGGLWGGEFLLGGYVASERVACLKPVPLPGGPAAHREPWRNTLAQLVSLPDWPQLQQQYADLHLLQALQAGPRAMLAAHVGDPQLSPPASSCGRLFDAVAAAVGICPDAISYEGQAAIELEAVVDDDALQYPGYPFGLSAGDGSALAQLDPAPMWRALLDDLARRTPVAVIAARFHCGLADAIAAMVRHLRDPARGASFDCVVLSGGVLQNRRLAALLQARLVAMQLRVLLPARLPAGDGGIAAGQAAVTIARAARKD